jgi:nitronate monooxygenase
VVRVDDTLSDLAVYEARERICDIGYLRHQYEREDGTLGYRCAAEPVDIYLKKGGELDETVGRACLCNCLVATAGFGQRRWDGYEEPVMVTSGDDLVSIGRLIKPGADSYSAADVIADLEGKALAGGLDTRLPAP